VPKFDAIITYDAVTRYHATVSVDADSEADAIHRAQVFVARGIVRPRYSALTSYSTMPEVEDVCLQNAR
jgi:hypothetical protein